MESAPPVPPTFVQNDVPSFAIARSQRRKMILIVSVIAFLVFATMATLVALFLLRRTTENRSQAALDASAPVVTTGKEGCFSTVIEQGEIFSWQDSCQGRQATEALLATKVGSVTPMSLVASATGAVSPSTFQGAISLSPTGVEQNSLILNAEQTVQSVSFAVNGTVYRVDSERPFSATRNEGAGYVPLTTLPGLRAGVNVLEMVSYAQKEATGSALKREAVTVSVQSRGTDRACQKTPMFLLKSEIAQYKQWVSNGRPLQAGCPAPQSSAISSTVLPILGCNSKCGSDTDCNGSVVTLVAKKPVGIASAVVLENININGIQIEEDGKELSYRGAWAPYVNQSLHAGKSIIYSVTADSSVSFYASGSYALITVDTGPNRIGFDVYIDGVKQTNTGLENLTIVGNGNINDLSNYKLKTVALGLPGKPSLYACNDVSGNKVCRLKTNTADSTCLVPAGTNTATTPAKPSQTVSALCNSPCTGEATCDGAKVYLVPKYSTETVKYAVIDKIIVGNTILEEDSTEITYFNPWPSYGPVAGYLDGATKVRYGAGIPGGTGTWLSFVVNGPSFTVKTDKGPNRSGYTVYIDNVLIPSGLDNLNVPGTTYSAYETTITIPGYDGNRLTCATVGTGKACRLTANPSNTNCTPQ